MKCSCELVFFLEFLEKAVPSIEKETCDRDFFIGGGLLHKIAAILEFLFGQTAGEELWNLVILTVFCIECIIAGKVSGSFRFLEILQDQRGVRRKTKIFIAI